MLESLVPLFLLFAGESLLANGDFSRGLEGWKANNEADAAVREVVESDGRTVARIAVPMDDAQGYPGLYAEFSVTPGDVLEMSVSFRAENVAGGYGAYAALEFYGDDTRRISFNQTDAARGNSDWRHVKTLAVAPPGATKARMVLLVNGHGTGFFDDARVVKTGVVRQEPLDGPVTITMTEEVACEAFLGFGFEDDGWFYNEENARHGVTEADYALKEARVRWMDPDRVRMFFWHLDWCPTGDWESFTFDSPNMLSHYRTLDLYQSLGTDVTVTGVEWGMEQPYADVPKAAKAIGALFEHLINVKGYDCVKYWILTNEPNGSWAPRGDSFEDYVALTHLVKKEFVSRGLNVKVVGSDDTNGFEWFTRCVEDPVYFADADLFSSHRYFAYPDRVLAPFFFFQERLELLATKEPRKPLVIEEFGFQDERSATLENPLMMTYPYAVWAMAFAIEGLDRGVAGMCIWALHEVYYPGNGFMEYGLWEFKDDDWKVRPVYHAWASLCRLTEKGDRVRRCVSTSPRNVRAVRVNDVVFWVNRAGQTAEIHLQGGTFKEVCVMTEDNLKGDREAGMTQALEDQRFKAPPQSFGYLR